MTHCERQATKVGHAVRGDRCIGFVVLDALPDASHGNQSSTLRPKRRNIDADHGYKITIYLITMMLASLAMLESVVLFETSAT